MPNNKFTIAVFYAEEDRQEYYTPLKKHLDPYIQESGFELNTIDNLLAGAETDAEIDKMIANAHVALLLLSIDLENSDSYKRYKQQLLARHKQKELYIMPIYTRKYTIKHSDWADLHLMPLQGKDDCNCLQDYFDKNKHGHICTEIIAELGKIVLKLQSQPLLPTSTPDSQKMNILVLSCAQNEILSKRKNNKPPKVNEWIMNQYGNTIGDWKPFKADNTIAELLAEYKGITHFDMEFIEPYPENFTFISENKDKIVAIIDSFVFKYMETDRKRIADIFAQIHDNIGGLLMPICERADAELYQLMLEAQKEFSIVFYNDYYHNDLHRCYIHIELNIPNKAELFRRLSNIAIGKLDIKSPIPIVKYVTDRYKDIQKQFTAISTLRNL
jgi:hypothetical protein